MRNVLAGLALGTLLLTNPAARAATTIDTGTFTLGWAGGYYPDLFDLSLLSASGGSYTFAFRQAEPLIDSQAYSPGFDEPAYGGDNNLTQLAASVRTGYRITGLTLSATVTGSWSVTPPSACTALACSVFDGEAGNSGGFYWSATRQGTQYGLPQGWVENLQGTTGLSQHAAVALDGEFQLDLITVVGSGARGSLQQVFGDEYYAEIDYPAEATFMMRDVVLTVQVSAVPEPHAWAMLAAGIAGVTLWGRRRT